MFKKLVSGILTGAMVLAACVPAFGAGMDSSAVEGLTTYDTPYTTYATIGDTAVNLSVTGMASDYTRTPLSEDEAWDVNWSVKTAIGGLDDSKIAKDIIGVEDDGYVASATVDVSEVKDYGYAMVEAALDNKTLDFTIVFNPAQGTTITGVTGITCKFTTGSEVLDEVKVPTVGKSDIAGSSEYPNALYATKLTMTTADSKVTAISGLENGYITSMTINKTTYDSKGGYWTYRLYDAAGNEIKDSVNVGANVIPLQNNYTVVWNYTAF